MVTSYNTNSELAYKADVQLMGEHYTVRGDVDSSYMVSIANYLEERIQTIHRENLNLDNYKALLLAALNITDELFQLQSKRDGEQLPTQELDRIRGKANSLISLLEDTLVGRETIYSE